MKSELHNELARRALVWLENKATGRGIKGTEEVILKDKYGVYFCKSGGNTNRDIINWKFAQKIAKEEKKEEPRPTIEFEAGYECNVCHKIYSSLNSAERCDHLFKETQLRLQKLENAYAIFADRLHIPESKL